MNFIKTNLIALLALIISFFSFLISLSNLLKARVKFNISYDDTETFCFGFTWYKGYKILISKIFIENKSNTTVSISKITLNDNNKSYTASSFNLPDIHNKDGLTLLYTDNESEGIKLNLISENILNNTRIEANGILKGYVVFFNVDLISEPKEYKIVVYTPNKKFSRKIIAKPIAPDYKTIYKYSD